MAEPLLKYEKKYFWSFLWALILAADMIAVSFFMAGERNMSRYIANDFNAEIISKFEKAKEKSDIGVILLGNSRLRHATTEGVDPDSIIRLPDGRRMAVLQFAYNAGRFDLYDALTPYILRAHPDLIVIQNSVISNAPGASPKLVKISGIVVDYFRKILTRYDERREWSADRHTLLIQCEARFDKAYMAQRISFMKKDHHSLIKENQGYVMAQNFLRQARAAGIRVVVLNLRPYTDLMARYAIPLDLVDFHGLGFYPTPEQLLPGLYSDLKWDSYQAPDESTQFCDDVHLNATGRKVFTSWLNKKITDDWLPR